MLRPLYVLTRLAPGGGIRFSAGGEIVVVAVSSVSVVAGLFTRGSDVRMSVSIAKVASELVPRGFRRRHKHAEQTVADKANRMANPGECAGVACRKGPKVGPQN